MKFRGGGATRKTGSCCDLLKRHSGPDPESINVDNRLRLGGRSDESGQITNSSFRHPELDSGSIKIGKDSGSEAGMTGIESNILRPAIRSDESSRTLYTKSRHSDGSQSLSMPVNLILHFWEQKSRKAAFTMAEVLITLGIIGIVASMTLPSLYIKNQNKALEASLKKNYSVLQQALDMYQAQNGFRLKSDDLDTHELKPAILPYFNVLNDCGVGTELSGKACIPNTEENKSNIYKSYNGNTITLAVFDDGQFVLNDGSLILLENVRYGYGVLISVDVNGYNKRPNRWGHDLFTFQLMKDGELLPMGAPETQWHNENTYCSTTSTNNMNGAGCTYKALTDKDYFNNLPK